MKEVCNRNPLCIVESKCTCILHEQILNQPAWLFFNYPFPKITPFKTSSQRPSLHDCKLLLGALEGMERETESQRFPCNHSYFLHWKLPIFALPRERITEDFEVCLKIDYGFLVFTKFKLKKKKNQQKKHKNNTYHSFLHRAVSLLCTCACLGSHYMLVFTIKLYKLKSSNRRTLWGQLVFFVWIDSRLSFIN